MRAIVALALILAGCSAASQQQDYLEEYGGNKAIYDHIASLTDCGELQHEFDIADDNNAAAEAGTDAFTWSLGYMTAADERMAELGCYD